MSGYFGYPAAAVYGAPQQAVTAAAASVVAPGYPMVPMPAAQQPAFVPTIYPSVYGPGPIDAQTGYAVQPPPPPPPQPQPAYQPVAFAAPQWQPAAPAVVSASAGPHPSAAVTGHAQVYGGIPSDSGSYYPPQSVNNLRTLSGPPPLQPPLPPMLAPQQPRQLRPQAPPPMMQRQPLQRQQQGPSFPARPQGAPRSRPPHPPRPTPLPQVTRGGPGSFGGRMRAPSLAQQQQQQPLRPPLQHQHQHQHQQQAVKSNLVSLSSSTNATSGQPQKPHPVVVPTSKSLPTSTGNNAAKATAVATSSTTANSTSKATTCATSTATTTTTTTATTTATTVKPTATAVPPSDDQQLAGAVGLEYILQIRTDQRGAAALQFHCRLCDCRFTDPQARDLHVKGRRHRMQYKRKVDPRLDVDAKPSMKARRSQDSMIAAQSIVYPAGAVSSAAAAAAAAVAAAARIRRLEEARLKEMQMLEWSNYTGCKTIGFSGGGSGPTRRPETNDDRHVLAKHSSVYPTEAELHMVQQLVTRCERALKLVSDHLSAEAAPAPAPLRGVMRVGVLAKGLLLHGDLSTQLVLLCAAWPSRALRHRVLDLLPDFLQQAGEEADKPHRQPQQQQQQLEATQAVDGQSQKLEVRLDEEEGCLMVVESDPEAGELVCSVYLTSPAVREESTGADAPEPDDVLDKEKCMEALAALRQAKWFQAKASSLQSCVVVVRVLRDLCQRLPIWNPLPEWAMELLVERSISSAEGSHLSPGEALRRVMECLSVGLLLPGGAGLLDPCEKSPVDAAAAMTVQEREDVTASAQEALRLIAYRQIHRVLDMEPLLSASATPAACAATFAPASAASAASAPSVASAGKRPAIASSLAAAAAQGAPANKQPRLS